MPKNNEGAMYACSMYQIIFIEIQQMYWTLRHANVNGYSFIATEDRVSDDQMTTWLVSWASVDYTLLAAPFPENSQLSIINLEYDIW